MLVGPFNASTWTSVSSSVSDAAVLLSVFVSVWPHPANRSTIARQTEYVKELDKLVD